MENEKLKKNCVRGASEKKIQMILTIELKKKNGKSEFFCVTFIRFLAIEKSGYKPKNVENTQNTIRSKKFILKFSINHINNRRRKFITIYLKGG